MQILFVTNMFPSEDHIYNGVHVKEQIEEVSSLDFIKKEVVFINGRKSLLNYLKSVFKVNYKIYRGNFDLIHIHFGLTGFFLLFNPFIKIPVVLTLHGSDTNPKKAYGVMLALSKLVAFRSKSVIVLNDFMVKRFSKISHKIYKIPCGINLDLFNQPRRNIDNKFCIGFPGDPARPGKNFELFSDIVRLLERVIKDIEIIIFHNLSREDVATKLSKLDCLLMTSLSEGSPQIIKEAMVCNVPVITTNVGDVSCLLDGVCNCYVVDSFNERDFIEPILKIFDLKKSERVTNGKQQIIHLGLDQKSISKRVLDVYKKSIAAE